MSDYRHSVEEKFAAQAKFNEIIADQLKAGLESETQSFIEKFPETESDMKLLTIMGQTVIDAKLLEANNILLDKGNENE